MDKLTFKEWSILSDLQTIAPLGEDFEFSMARGELKTAQAAITRLMTKLKGEGDLEAWVQSKITKAAEYLDTVADHLSHGEDDTERKKEVEEEFKGHKSVEEIAKKHKVSPSSIQKQLEMGMKVEHEHTTDNDEAMDIALQHLDEIPNYYSKLKKMEKVKEEWTELHDANGNTFAHVVDIIKGSDYKFKSFTQPVSEKCWDGYKQVGMKKKGEKVVPNCVKEDSIDEGNKSGDSSLRDWFTKSRASDGTPGWVQLGGKYAGKPCAKQEGQTTKPKCGSSKMKSDLSDKEEESAFRRKNQEDPNPDRKGKAKMVATEAFKPLPSEKMKNKMMSFHKKSLDSDNSDEKGENIRRSGNIRTVSDTIGKSQKTKSFGTTEKEKNKSAKYAAKSFLRQHLKSTQNTKDSPDHQGRWNKMITRTDEGKKKHLEKRSKEREKRFGSDHAIKEENISEKKDACYSKVKSRYKVWPSAYASGALVKCRKVGAANWGNKTKKEEFIPEEMGVRYCSKCQKNETASECKYGEGYWRMFSLPSSLAPEQPYSIAKVHPANENVSFEIGSGHRQAQKQAKIRNLATGNTNPNEKNAALKKLSGPSLPLADSVIQPGQITNEDYQRIQSTGNVYTILFSWRGRPMMNLQLFFPNMKRPSKDEVKAEIEKFYPGAVILQWYPSPTDPSKPIVVIQGK